MLARWIATVAALLLACAQASAHVRAERAADLGTFAAGTEHALEIQRAAANASPGELPTNPKIAPPARASLENSASGKNAPVSDCHAWENWSPLKKCASGVDKYLYANGNPGSYLDPDGRQSVDLQVQSCDENGSCNTTPMAASALPFIDPSQFATQRQADAVIEARARMALFGGGRSDSPMVAQPLLASGAGHYQQPYVEHGSSRQLSAMQSSAALDQALSFDPNYVPYGQATEAVGEMAVRSIPPVAVVSGVHTMASAKDGWQFTAGALEATLGTLPMAFAARAELAAFRAELAATRGRPAVVLEGSSGAPVIRSVDSEAGIGQIEHPPLPSQANNTASFQRLREEYHSLDTGLHQEAATRGYPGIRLTEQGNPNFSGSRYLYEGVSGQNEVRIALTGSYYQDFKAANQAAGFGGAKAPSGHTWHHLDDFDPSTGMSTLQLIEQGAHRATYPHFGSVSQYEKHIGVDYR